MSKANDARFWDRTSRKYAASAILDRAGYERTLDRTRALLGSGDRVLELGCGTGTTALLLADDVQHYLATDISAGMIAIANEKRAVGPNPGPCLSHGDRGSACARGEDRRPNEHIRAAGFDILAIESHAANDNRPYIVARKL